MIKEINEHDLLKMKDKEGLILQGCGGDLNDWLQGINEDFTKRNILMNNSKFEDIYSFKSGEITNLLFPLDNADVNVPKLAMWRIGTHEVFGGTWLSDYIDNRLSDKEEVVNNENQEVIKPDCELIGQDSNIFNLMGIASKTLKRNGMSNDAKEMCDRITSSGSYDEALSIIDEYGEITSADDEETEDFGMEMM